jgi:hypothetical protein
MITQATTVILFSFKKINIQEYTGVEILFNNKEFGLV